MNVGEMGAGKVQRWLSGDVHFIDISWESSICHVLDIDTEMKRRSKIWGKDQEKLPRRAGF